MQQVGGTSRRKRTCHAAHTVCAIEIDVHAPSQDFLDELAARVNTLQNQNAMLLSQMAGAAKLLNAAVVENQILKAELHALDTNGTPKPAVSPAWGHAL